jgi:Ca2+/Na+ antiporter
MTVALMLLLAALAAACVGAIWLAGQLLRSGLRAGWAAQTISLVLLPVAVGLPVVAATAVLFALHAGPIALALCIGVAITGTLLGVGLLAFHTPIELSRRVIRQEWIFLTAAGAMLWLAGADGVYSRLDGQFLLTLGVIRLWMLGEELKSESVEDDSAGWDAGTKHSPTRLVWLAAAGLLTTVGGAGVGWGLAEAHGRLQPMPFAGSDLVLTVALGPVAIVLGLAMLAFFFEAGSHGRYDHAFGVLVGTLSLIWMVGLPICLLIWPMPAPPAVWWLDQPAMLAALIALLPMMRPGRRLGRAEGFVLLIGGIVYVCWGMLSGLL